MPAENKGFGALFGDAKAKLDSLQASMASVIPAFPGMPVAKYFDLAIGIDFEPTIWPPSPIFPVPHIGMVFDIFGAIMVAIADLLPTPPAPPPVPEGEDPPPQPLTLLGVATAVVSALKPSVLVHNQWVANAGTAIQHLPGIIVHLLPLAKPLASSEMWMGSSTVLADGGPCSTQFHPALSCNLIGIPSLFRMNKPPKPKIALMAPTSMLLVITSGGAPVLVGGPPTIDLFQLMFKMALKGLGKLWRKGRAKFKAKAPDTKTPKLGGIQPDGKCSRVGEPVDMATGRVYHTNTDFTLPGPIPLVWERTYYSDVAVDGPLGYNWHHSYNLGLHDDRNGFFTLRLADGRETAVPQLVEGDSYYNRREGITWSRDEHGYWMKDRAGLFYRFSHICNRAGYAVLASIETAVGQRILFSYDATGRLKGLTDSAGRALTVETDKNGRILAIHTVADGERLYLVRYAYDEAGNMVRTADAADAAKHFHYDGHLLVKLTNQSGMSFYWTYEGQGDDARCIRTWGDGGILEYTTHYEPGVTTTTNGLGATTRYFFDERSLIYKIEDAEGGVTHQHYNADEELEVVVNPDGLSTKTVYNEWGDVVRTIDYNGQATAYTYDGRRRLVGVSSPGGRSLSLAYDDLDRVVRRESAGGSPLTYEYEGAELRRIVTANGRAFSLAYNAQGALAELAYPTGTTAAWTYDELGNTLTARDVRGNLTQYGYDRAGNLTNLVEPDGNTHHLHYDTAGNLIKAKDDLREVAFSYGPLGTLTGRMQGGTSVRFAYDSELQLRSILNEGGEVYRFGLDRLGQVVSEVGFDGAERKYERDGSGRVRRVARPGGRWTEYDYDGMGRVIRDSHSDGTGAAYRYDKDGLMLEAFNEDGHITLQRDRAGRVVKETQGQHSVSKHYRTDGVLEAITSSLGADIGLDHNEDGWLTGMRSGKVEERTAWQSQWTRDEAGLEVQRQMSGGVSVATERDKLGRVVRRSTGAGNLEGSRTAYNWGKGNRLHSIVNELTKATSSFEYDAFDNLVAGTYADGPGVETVYRAPDAIGNLFKTKARTDRKYGKGGQLLEDLKHNYYYDAEGNLIFKELRTISAPGKRLDKKGEKELGIKARGSGVGWVYEWAGNGMLRSVTLPQGGVVSFNYDPLGRRVGKGYKGKVTRWLWDGNVPLHEWSYEGVYPPPVSVDAEGRMVEAKEEVENLVTWVYEEGSFVPCGKITGEEEYSIVSDYLGTPTHAYNGKGEKVWERELDVYGVAKKELGVKGLVPQLYQGQWVDEETGLAYNRFRYYDAQLGGYLSQDPIKLGGGSCLYNYVSDSTSAVDPTGLAPIGSWNEFLRQTKGQFTKANSFHPDKNTMRDASSAWREYKNNLHSANTPVIGGLADTGKFKGVPGYNVLDSPRWNLNVNDAWVRGGIDRAADFDLVSARTAANLWDAAAARPKVYARELDMLKKAGYTEIGDKMVHPNNLKKGAH